MHINIIKIFVLTKIGSHRLINVTIDKILKNAVSLTIKWLTSDNIKIMITVKNIANIIFIILKIIFIYIL